MTTGECKQYKRLRKENLRDNMTHLELVLNMLAEATTTELSKKILMVLRRVKLSLTVVEKLRNTRCEIESDLGHSIISSRNVKKNRRLLDEGYYNFEIRGLPIEGYDDELDSTIFNILMEGDGASEK